MLPLCPQGLSSQKKKWPTKKLRQTCLLQDETNNDSPAPCMTKRSPYAGRSDGWLPGAQQPTTTLLLSIPKYYNEYPDVTVNRYQSMATTP